MLSQGLLPVSQQFFYSTHNALNDGQVEEQKLVLNFHETRGTRKLSISIYPFYDVQTVKRLLIKRLNLPGCTEIKDLRILYKGTELPNYRVMTNFDTNSKKRLFFELREDNPKASIRPLGFRLSSQFDKVLSECRLALQRNIAPKLTMEGTGGTYLLSNCQRKIVAVFKPADEEAFAPCNPRGYEGQMAQQGFRAGVLSGEGASREVAGYFLDTLYDGAVDVPETTMVEACHPAFHYKREYAAVGARLNIDESSVTWKTGSLQAFVPPTGGMHTETCGNYDACLFAVEDVHNIGAFDIRVMNLDRNDGNILIQGLKSQQLIIGRHRRTYVGMPGLTPEGFPSKYHLVPIDHGLILPDVLDVANIDLVWYEWPQTQVPFSESTVRLILSYEPDRDAERLKRKLFIRDECLRTLRVATRLLQTGVRMHLTLRQISEMSSRSDIDEPSVLEDLVNQAMKQVYRGLDSTSLIATNKLGYHIDLAECSFVPSVRLYRASTTREGDGKLRRREAADGGGGGEAAGRSVSSSEAEDRLEQRPIRGSGGEGEATVNSEDMETIAEEAEGKDRLGSGRGGGGGKGEVSSNDKITSGSTGAPSKTTTTTTQSCDPITKATERTDAVKAGSECTDSVSDRSSNSGGTTTSSSSSWDELLILGRKAQEMLDGSDSSDDEHEDDAEQEEEEEEQEGGARRNTKAFGSNVKRCDGSGGATGDKKVAGRRRRAGEKRDQQGHHKKCWKCGRRWSSGKIQQVKKELGTVHGPVGSSGEAARRLSGSANTESGYESDCDEANKAAGRRGSSGGGAEEMNEGGRNGSKSNWKGGGRLVIDDQMLESLPSSALFDYGTQNRGKKKKEKKDWKTCKARTEGSRQGR
eukprot:GHVS01080830.1.p1 GENE.GHVS01080830.1~~GHVS01080830.1.p1  ORF type:complete len:866 (+),score=182.46 GHVS01080830.1:581-3178(+)